MELNEEKKGIEKTQQKAHKLKILNGRKNRTLSSMLRFMVT
jgi:hypothetical protein